MTTLDKQEREDLETRGEQRADIRALKEHAGKVNGSLDGIYERLGNLETLLANVVTERKSIVSLQNRQVAVVAALGTAIYLIVQLVH